MPSQPDHIENLFEQARSGDQRALELYCELARRGLLIIAKRELPEHPSSVIEDIVHDTLEAFIQQRDEITGSSAAYLRGILFNKIKLELRRKYSGNHRSLNGNGHQHTASGYEFEDTIELKDRVEHCLRVISKLEDPDRTMLLESVKGTSVEGIWLWYRTFNPAAKFDAFKRRLYRARQRLWDLLEEDQ